MNDLTVFYNIVGDKFFVIYIYDGKKYEFVKEEKIFNSCDKMVDYYRDKMSDYITIKFSIIY